MRVCRECSSLRQRIEAATEAVTSQNLDETDASRPPPIQREASLRSLRTGSAWATRSVSAAGYEDVGVLHERLQATAVQALLQSLRRCLK